MTAVIDFVSAWVGKLTRTAAERSRITWDGLYQSGEPERYGSLEQCARYGVIEAYCKTFGRPVSVLEVGCGAGVLVDRCDKSMFARYCGIDVSHVGIEKARQTWGGGDFVVSPAEEFNCEKKSFDVVIFNESLYYLNDMTGELRRYLLFLKEDGRALVSISGLESDAQNALEREFRENIVSQTSIVDHGSGKSWIVYMLSRSPGARVQNRLSA